jgi:hypothetical protein
VATLEGAVAPVQVSERVSSVLADPAVADANFAHVRWLPATEGALWAENSIGAEAALVAALGMVLEEYRRPEPAPRRERRGRTFGAQA